MVLIECPFTQKVISKKVCECKCLGGVNEEDMYGVFSMVFWPKITGINVNSLLFFDYNTTKMECQQKNYKNFFCEKQEKIVGFGKNFFVKILKKDQFLIKIEWKRRYGLWYYYFVIDFILFKKCEKLSRMRAFCGHRVLSLSSRIEKQPHGAICCLTASK